MPNQHSHNLEQEAEAFDTQIEERIANGHVPDLSYSKPCDWFYNNPWRRPAYVRLDIGEQFELVRDAIRDNNGPGRSSPQKILEVGCGPGYLSLELARAGFDVTGLDVSPKCIEVAIRFADSDPQKQDRGRLNHLVGDFYTHPDIQEDYFDAIVFLGALHHFPDQDATVSRARSLLRVGGIIIAHEPVRDRVTKGNAAFVHLLRVLVSIQHGFYKTCGIPATTAQRDAEINKLFNEMRYELADGEKAQSINDNEAGYREMYPALKKFFVQKTFEWRYAFFHEFIGGLRFEESRNIELATYLRDIDKELCKLGVLQATEFFFVGKTK